MATTIQSSKKKIIRLWIMSFALLAMAVCCVINTSDAYAKTYNRYPARCKKPWREYTYRTKTGRANDGYYPMILVSSSSLGSFSDLGGPEGVKWACENQGSDKRYSASAIIFPVKSIGYEYNFQTRDADLNQDDPQQATRYTLYTDYEISTTGNTPVKLMGLVHYDPSFLKNASNYAIHIGFCLHSGECKGKSGHGEETINQTARYADAGGVVAGGSQDLILRRQGTDVNPPNHVYSGWTTPYSGYYTTININGPKLIEKIKTDNNLQVSSDDFRNAVKNGTETTGWVKLYIHRCWSNDGSSMLYDDTCKEAALYLYVKIPPQEDPETTFDGSVVANVGSCTAAECEVSTASSTVTFTYKMSRGNNGKNGNVSNGWTAYYHSDFAGNYSSSAGATGTVTYGKNTGLTAITNSPQNVTVTLNPGESKTVCQKLVFNGTVAGNGTGSNSQTRYDCMKVTRRNNSHYFTGSVSSSVKDMNPTTSGGKRYETESHTATITFNYNVCRTDTNEPASQSSYWKAFYGKGTYAYNSNADKAGTDAFDKANGNTPNCKQVHTSTRENKTLTAGQDVEFCGTLGWIKNVKESGIQTDTWDTTRDCVTIHEYAWYSMQGQVVFSTDATKKGDYYWTDSNKTKIQFSHQFKTDTTASIKPKFQTSKNENLGSSFNTTGTSYVQGNLTTKSDGWKTSYNSPTSAKGEVDVAKDNGTTFQESVSYYPIVREDSGNYRKDANGNMGSASNELTVRRYKTNFTGSTAVYINNDKSVNYADYAADAKERKIKITGTSYPVSVPVSFIHTVKRNAAATSAPYDSPYKKRSTITTSIDGTTGYRSGDPHGAARTGTVQETETIDLAANDTASYPDEFTVKVYPEQEITLCQQMTYRSEIQGAEVTKPSTKATQQCITLYMEQATCPDDFSTSFGIKEAKNLMKVDVYKNGTTADDIAGTSGIRSDGSKNFVVWAKPDDLIRFNYNACAGGDIAQQYDVNNSKETKYDISANAPGNLYGNALSSAPDYKETTKNIGKTNASPGTGPFSGGKYSYSVTSPSGNNIYSCPYYGNSGDFYRIQSYFDGLSSSDTIKNCAAATLGSTPTDNDLGKTIAQTATWTDTQYSGGSPLNGHNGNSASITAQVKIPYNYNTSVKPSGKGGYIIPGNNISETIILDVVSRDNETVGENYSTATKETKYQLIEIVVGSSDPTEPGTFNSWVGKDTLHNDNNGSKNLANVLPICTTHGYSCTRIIDGGGKRYDSSSDSNIASTSHKIPTNIEPGTKYCYVAAVWPSDSHNNPGLKPTLDSHNDPAMVEAGVAGYSYYWKASGATCYTTAKRPSIAVLNGDTYAQGHISARVQKYPEGGKDRIFGSWTEYSAISGESLKGFASGASLWGGSDIISNNPTKQTCAFGAYTFANSDCKNNNLGSMDIDITTSSNPETIANQMITRYTRTDNTGKYPRGANNTNNPLLIEDAGTCKYENGTYSEQYSKPESTFSCIGDTGAKYTHVKNNPNQPAYIPNITYCMVKGDTNNSRTSIIHVDNTLVVGGNMYYGKPTTGAGCAAETYNSISEIPQSILIAKKIIIKSNVTHLDTWLIADEIITCDPSSAWRIDVPADDINTHNCDQQLTINGPVMAKDIKLYRTFGTGYTYYTNGTVRNNYTASPAEVFTMGPEVYFWSFNQAQRYSQATTTYARELAPRY